MPKKFGSNTKSVEARARKEAVRQAEKSKKEQEAEDAYWKDEDKTVQRKQQRKDEKEKKKQDVLDRKEANKQAYEEEMSSLKAINKSLPTSKVTRADITAVLQSKANDEKPKRELLHDEAPLEENINRLTCEGEEARTIDEAISVLSVSGGKVDRHPERRLKAAYDAFEEKHLPRLKAENPNMRLSQLKQMLKKDWMRSPDNPLNQNHLQYNSKMS